MSRGSELTGDNAETAEEGALADDTAEDDVPDGTAALWLVKMLTNITTSATPQMMTIARDQTNADLIFLFLLTFIKRIKPSI
jgi:hypothetical protein